MINGLAELDLSLVMEFKEKIGCCLSRLKLFRSDQGQHRSQKVDQLVTLGHRDAPCQSHDDV